MVFIIFADKCVWSLDSAMKTPTTGFLATQFRHAEWFGSTVYDIVMPLFLFVVGAVIPYSLSEKVQKQTSKFKIHLKLVRRVIILFILGWIVQGNLLSWDLENFHVFSNTLQAIAVGYFFTSLAFLYLDKKWRYALFVFCLVAYVLMLTIPMVPGVGGSVLLPDKNFGIYFDRLVLGKYHDGTQYVWLLSSLGFIATTLTGLFASELIKSNKSRSKVAMYSLLLGIALLVVGLIWAYWHPIVKRLWNSTFVLFSSGICFILMALFYWVIDIKGYKSWIFPFKIIGMNAISAYVLSLVFDFSQFANSLLYGLEQYVGEYYQLLINTAGFGLLYLLLWYMYKNKTFIKV